MSFQAVDWSMTFPCATRAEKTVLIVVAHHFNEDDGLAWPGIARLAACTQLSERHVQRCLRSLERVGLIETASRYRKGRQITNGYYLPFYREPNVTAVGDRKAA